MLRAEARNAGLRVEGVETRMILAHQARSFWYLLAVSVRCKECYIPWMTEALAASSRITYYDFVRSAASVRCGTV